MAFEAQMDQYGNPENVNAMGVGVHVPGEDPDQGAGVDAESMLIQQLASQVDFEAPMGQNGNFEAVNASGVGLQVAGEEPNHFEGEDAEATLIQQLASQVDFQQPMDQPPMDQLPMDQPPMDQLPMDQLPMDQLPMDQLPMDPSGGPDAAVHAAFVGGMQVANENPDQFEGEDAELALIQQLTNQVQYTGVPGAAPSGGLATGGQGQAGIAEVDHLIGLTLNGRIKIFGDTWGFINSESFAGDLFLHKAALADSGPICAGDPVQFEIDKDMSNSAGGCHAVNVHVMKEDVASLVGQRVVGWVKSFKDTWGHINSNRFIGDVFLGLKANKHLVGAANLAKGVHVEFTVAPSHKDAAGMQALNVTVLGGNGTGGVGAMAGMATMAGGMAQLGATAANPAALAAAQMMGVGGVAGVMTSMRPEALVGCRLEGMIKRFKDKWGFIVSPSFEGDLFVHRGSSPNFGGLGAGDAVCFDIAQQSSGRCHAINVQPAGMDSPLGMSRSPPLASLEGQRVAGKIRSFTGNWGFAISDSFAGDIFIGSKSNPHLGALNPGDPVEFTVSRSSAGKSTTGFEGINVQVVGGESAGLMDATAFGDAGAVPGMTGASAGNLAMMDAAAQANQALLMQGVGVTGLAGVTGVAGGNLNMMGTAAAGTGRSRSPRISASRTGGDTGRQAASLAGAAVGGWVKSFKGDWGFVNSQSFDGDLFIGLRSNPQLQGILSAGDQVMFQISVGPGGKAEAINVQVLAADQVLATPAADQISASPAADTAGIELQESQAPGTKDTCADPLQ